MSRKAKKAKAPTPASVEAFMFINLKALGEDV